MVKLNVFKVLLITFLLITIFSSIVETFAVDNPGDYKPSQEIKQGTFTKKVNKILGYIQVVGMVVAVVGAGVIGLGYIFGSVEGKAEYKKTVMPYLIGCAMLVSTSIIISVIRSVASVE